MGRSLTSSSCRVIALALLAACGGGALETATELPESPRRPSGVALEPSRAYPPVADRAEAKGVVALREPVGDEDVEELVRAYVGAFERADERALARLVAEDASLLGRPGSTRRQLVETWRAKLRSLSQSHAGPVSVRIGRIERSTYETMERLGRPRPAEMRPGDLYVRVSIPSRVEEFGETLVLLLRREDGVLKIAGQADE